MEGLSAEGIMNIMNKWFDQLNFEACLILVIMSVQGVVLLSNNMNTNMYVRMVR
jgi:hypothetical protein